MTPSEKVRESHRELERRMLRDALQRDTFLKLLAAQGLTPAEFERGRRAELLRVLRALNRAADSKEIRDWTEGKNTA